MADNTKIEWADHTFNPWEGCQKVGPGCDNCYAEARNARFHGGRATNWGPGAPRRRTSPVNWRKPLKWNAEAPAFAEAHGGRKQRVFCASLADVFDNAVEPQWRADLFELILRTPNLDWLLVTKRIGNVVGMLGEMGYKRLPPHVWLGATVVNQAEADRDIPKLLTAPAAIRFLSMEPLLGPIDLRRICIIPQRPGSIRAGIHVDALAGKYVESGTPYIGEWDVSGAYPTGAPTVSLDWVIVGGESGPNARPMHPDWARSLRDQCQRAGVPFFFKQWGEWFPYGGIDADGDQNSRTMGERWGYWHTWPDGIEGFSVRIGKTQAGRCLDGAKYSAWPEDGHA